MGTLVSFTKLSFCLFLILLPSYQRALSEEDFCFLGYLHLAERANDYPTICRMLAEAVRDNNSFQVKAILKNPRIVKILCRPKYHSKF